MSGSKLFLAGLVTLMVAGCLQSEQGAAMTTKEIETMVQREIPLGSNKSQVIAFLDGRKIEHSGYLETEKAVYAIIRNTSQGAIVKGAIKIEFYFDEQANLKNYTIKEVFTGP